MRDGIDAPGTAVSSLAAPDPFPINLPEERRTMSTIPASDSADSAATTSRFVGILLAAGSGMRFDPSGSQDKLLQKLPDGRSIAVAAADSLLSAVPNVIAVVRPGATGLAYELSAIGCEVVVCNDAHNGMASSLVHALTLTSDAAGWVVALADMPRVLPSTITSLIDAVSGGADIAVPSYHGLRGNPVAFGPAHLPNMLRLTGDEGARRLLEQFFVTEIMVEDPGVRLDIDTPTDLRRVTA